MSLNTFDIGSKRLRYVAKKRWVSGSGICANDQRGKHGKLPQISAEDKQFVVQHITQFPTYQSHYSRSHSATRYLSLDLSIQQIMYRLYVKECNDIRRKKQCPITFIEMCLFLNSICLSMPQKMILAADVTNWRF